MNLLDEHELLVTYLELLFEEGKDGGRDDPSNATTVDAQNGDELDLFEVSLVCTLCRTSACHFPTLMTQHKTRYALVSYEKEHNVLKLKLFTNHNALRSSFIKTCRSSTMD